MHAVLRLPGSRHQLYVVDDDHAQILAIGAQLRLEATRLGADLEHVAAGCIVDPDGRGVEVPGRGGEPLVFLRREAPSPQLQRVDTPFGAQESLDELLGRHLE